MPDLRPRRLVVAITGATGAVYGVRLVQQLAATPGIETHLIVSDSAVLTLHQELGMQRRDVEALAHVVHKNRDVGASIASGSFQSDGMVIAPCSMKTLAAVALGLSDNLPKDIWRAQADVIEAWLALEPVNECFLIDEWRVRVAAAFGQLRISGDIEPRMLDDALLAMRFQFWYNERARIVNPAWEYADAEKARLLAMQAVLEQVRAGAGKR